jgi:phosphatidate cytidylyltransferase
VNTLSKRVSTGLTLAFVATGLIIYAPFEVILALAGVVTILATLEWESLRVGKLGTVKAFLFSIFTLLTTFLFVWLFANIAWTVWALGLGWAVLLIWVGAVALSGQTRNVSRARLLGPLIICPSIALIPVIHATDSNGPIVLLAAFAAIWGSDTGAYFSGRKWGKHRLAPKVSPGKTWEGVSGGLLLGLLAGFGIIRGFYDGGIPYFSWLVLLFISIFAGVIGDLFESMFKRSSGKKDSGNLLPGHGGILDRIDSMLAFLPIFAVFIVAGKVGV